MFWHSIIYELFIAVRDSCEQCVSKEYNTLIVKSQTLLIIFALAVLPVLASHAKRSPEDSAGAQVEIRCVPDDATFPVFRFGDPARKPLYTAKPLSTDEIDRSERIVREELRKFPPAIVKRYLDRVYLLGQLTFRDVEVGGVNFRQTRTICLSAGPGATDSFIARLFDHEMIHLLVSGRAQATRSGIGRALILQRFGMATADWRRFEPDLRWATETIRAGQRGSRVRTECRI